MEIEQAKTEGDYPRAIRAARAAYALLSDFVDHQKREYGSWQISSVRAIDTAGTLMAVVGDREALALMRRTVESIPDLREWQPVVEAAERDAGLVEAILAAVEANAGIAQTDLKQHVPTDDTRRLATLVSWLEKGGRIRRVRLGKTYRLFLPGAIAEEFPSARSATGVVRVPSAVAQPPIVPRSTASRAACQAREVDLESLPYVRLPKAPLRWEERQRREHESGGDVRRSASDQRSRFSVDGVGWEILDEDRLRPADRPDPAYKDLFATGGATFWLDRKGRRDGFEDALSALRVTDRSGNLLAERGLGHDAYRASVNTGGLGIILLSRDGLLCGNSDRLEPILAERVADLPEYRAQAGRFGIPPDRLKNHTRCVAVSADRSRYLLTVVDEAWCLSTRSGDVLWGLRLPTQEGWRRVVRSRSDRYGTDAEVMQALGLMGLHLPATPADITKQYRALAMRWHPDRNPGDPGATQKFQRLASAMELLTGVDLSGASGREVEEVTYEKVLGRSPVEIPLEGPFAGSVGIEITASMSVSERHAADWIYAANFGSRDSRVYLAGYSGKVVEVSPEGDPLRAYDIGSVPRHIAQSGSLLYLLTDTRLYVLSPDGLENVVDVFDQGELLVGETGFGLLQPKAFTWFTPLGRRLGQIRARDPIRRVFSTPAGVVVETRQHRAVVRGAPGWWAPSNPGGGPVSE